MKNLFTFSLILVFFSSQCFSQIHSESFQKYTKAKFIQLEKGKTRNQIPELGSISKNNPNNYIYRVNIGKSANAQSVLRTERKPLSFYWAGEYGFYNTHYLTFTFGADPVTYPNANSDGSLIMAYSEGSNDMSFEYFDDFILDNNHSLSYPSSIIFNPDGSRYMEDYYFLTSSFKSINDNAFSSHFASSKMDEAFYNEYEYSWQADIDEITSGIHKVENTAFLSGISYDTINGFGLNQKLKHYKGTSNDLEEGFNWEVTEISPNWLHNDEENYDYALYKTWSAWSNDGEIGYMWIIGVTEESYEYGVYQPQIYYTTNSGDSWQYLELNLEDHPVLVDYLEPWQDENGNPGTVRPSFLNGDQQYPGEVDYHGNLHLFANVYGSTTGDVLNENEANWVDENALGGHLFSFIIDINGYHQIEAVSEIKTKVSSNSFGNLGFDHRIQTSKINIEGIIVCSWIDDIISGADSLVYPDIFAWNNCVGWGTVGPENISQNTLYEGFYFYPTLAKEVVFNDLYWGINIFMSTSVSVNEYADNDPTSPVTHHNINGVEMELVPECLEGVSEESIEANIFSISQNEPNPFSGQTTILVEYHQTQAEQLYIEVTNIQGKTIYSSDEGIIYDSKEIVLSKEDFKSGIYFYTISIGQYSLTKKMIVM